MAEPKSPFGFKERFPAEAVASLAWSGDGVRLAIAAGRGVAIREERELSWLVSGRATQVSASADGTEVAARSPNGQWQILGRDGQTESVGEAELVVWSPVERALAVARDSSVEVTRPEGRIAKWTWTASNPLLACSWSPDGSGLAIGCAEGSCRILNAATGKVRRALEGNASAVRALCWSADGTRVAAGCEDGAVRVWDAATGKMARILEGHTRELSAVGFTPDGRLAVSMARDNTLRAWRCDVWDEVAVYRLTEGERPPMAIHPREPILAVWNPQTRFVELFAIDAAIAMALDIGQSRHYVNAKIVLVGDTGVGKSGLGIRIAESRFQVTESTHGASFWQLEPPAETLSFPEEARVRPELTLWDFAGQPEYHLIHQLFLDDAEAALLVYTCDRPDDPFRGVEYWAKALKQHLPRQARKYLVAARTDVNPVTVSQRRIDAFLSETGLERHFQTCAKTGKGVPEMLREVLREIRWNDLTRITVPRLFSFIRIMLLERKETEWTLISLPDLHCEIRRRYPERDVAVEEIEAVIKSLQTRGLVYRLEPVGQAAQVLLRPELINQYGSSIIQAARAHPKSLGAVLERDVVRAGLPFTGVERAGAAEEALILEATVELLVRHQLCFRHMGQLVFPSQMSKVRPPFGAGRPRSEVTYHFAGSVEAIYASLVVSLSYTSYFELEECWSYAAEFSRNRRRLGFSMQQTASGGGELEIYFYDGIDKYDRVSFVRFITDHLRRHGIDVKESIRLYCKNPNCGEEVTNRRAIEKRIQAGKTDIKCQVCESVIEIPRSVEQIYEKVESVRITVQRMQDETVRATDSAVKDWREAAEIRSAAGEDGRSVRILHLSDLHVRPGDLALTRAALETDLRQRFELHRLDYLILSGDIADKALPEEYEAAAAFIDKLAKLFCLSPDRMIVVPGNHDVNWDLSEDAFRFVSRRRLPAVAPSAHYVDLGDEGVLMCDEAKYKERFLFFSQHFYRKVMATVYPIDYEQQFSLQLHPEDRILFLGLNTCWQLDHRNRERAGVYPTALAGALDQLNQSETDGWLKIAVWHHPVGVGTFDDAFLGLLARHGFQLGIQGHIHESKRGAYRFDSGTAIQILGGGTFSAPAQEQVTGIPLQYSLLTYDRDRSTVRVDSRRQERRGGAWIADARHGSADRPVAHETIRLKRSKAAGRAAS